MQLYKNDTFTYKIAPQYTPLSQDKHCPWYIPYLVTLYQTKFLSQRHKHSTTPSSKSYTTYIMKIIHEPMDSPTQTRPFKVSYSQRALRHDPPNFANYFNY